MRILHLLYESKGDYFGIGGVGARAYEIYKYLKDRHDVTLLCKKYPGAKDGEINGLRHIFVGTESKSLAKTFISYAYHASRFVRRYGNDYDIIVEEFSPAIPTFLHFFTERPIVLQIQGYTGLLYFRKYNPFYAFFLNKMERLRPLFYKDFIFINGNTADRLLSKRFLYHISEERGKGCIKVIPNGISPELLSLSPEDGDYILYLGRIDIYGKGLDTLIMAYKDFYGSFPDIKLVIAGDGRDREKFDAMLRRLPDGVRKNIELTGWVSGDKKAEVLRKALFCVFPSRHETQGITVLEAMACEKAVIVSNIPELRYAIESGAGLSFEAGAPFSLTCSMKDLMRSDRRKEMGLMGREWVKGFTWDRIAAEYEEFLLDVIEKDFK